MCNIRKYTEATNFVQNKYLSVLMSERKLYPSDNKFASIGDWMTFQFSVKYALTEHCTYSWIEIHNSKKSGYSNV